MFLPSRSLQTKHSRCDRLLICMWWWWRCFWCVKLLKGQTLGGLTGLASEGDSSSLLVLLLPGVPISWWRVVISKRTVWIKKSMQCLMIEKCFLKWTVLIICLSQFLHVLNARLLACEQLKPAMSKLYHKGLCGWTFYSNQAQAHLAWLI